MTKTVIASTASPFKFAKSVMKAIGKISADSDEDDFAVIDQLSDAAKVPVPQAVEDVRHGKVRDRMECDPSDMEEIITGLLKA